MSFACEKAATIFAACRGTAAIAAVRTSLTLTPGTLAAVTAMAGAEGVLTVKRSDDVSQGGAVFLNEKFELTDLREKPKPGEQTSPWYNAGIYAFRPSIFDYIAKLRPSPRGEYELTDALRDLALAGKKVQALEIAGDWADVRDPEILAQLNR